MKKHRHLLLFLLTTIVIYACMYGFYMLMSVGIPDKTIFLQMRRYIPCAFAVSASLWLWWLDGLPFRKILPHAIVALAWAIVFPLCYWLTFHLNTSFIDNHYDISFGGYIFAFTVSFRLLLLKYGTSLWQRVDSAVMGLIHTLLLIIPVIQVIYFFNYQSPITEAGAMALLQTNANEAKEFVLLNFGYAGIAAFAVFWIVVFCLFYLMNRLDGYVSGLLPKGLITLLVIFIATGA